MTHSFNEIRLFKHFIPHRKLSNKKKLIHQNFILVTFNNLHYPILPSSVFILRRDPDVDLQREQGQRRRDRGLVGQRSPHPEGEGVDEGVQQEGLVGAGGDQGAHGRKEGAAHVATGPQPHQARQGQEVYLFRTTFNSVLYLFRDEVSPG